MARRGWLGFPPNVVFLGLTSLLNDTGSEIIYPLLPAFLTTVLGAGPVFLGTIEGIADTTASLLKVASGWLSDRRQTRKGLVVGGYALPAVVRPLIALATAPWHVLLIRFGDRAGKGVRSAPRDALLADSIPAAARGRSFGLHRAMDHLGAVIGPLLAFVLIAVLHERYRAVFAIAAIPGVLAVIVLALLVREPRRHAAAAARIDLRRSLPVPFWKFIGIVFLFTLGNSSDAFLLLRAQQLGVSIAALPLLWALLHVVKSATSVPGSGLSDRLGRARVIALGWLVYAVVYLGFAHAGSGSAVWWLFAVYGVFFGLTEGSEKALVTDLTPAPARGSGFGIYHLAVGAAALPASVLFGALWAAFSPAAAFTTGAGLALAAAVLLMLLVSPAGEISQPESVSSGFAGRA